MRVRGSSTAGSPGLTSKTVTYTGIPSQTLAYAFWPNGSRKTLTTSQGSFSYTYDGVGRMTGLTNPFAEASSWTYKDNGWLQTQALGNGAATTYTRDPQGRLTDLLNKTSGGTTLSDFGVPSTGGYDGIDSRLAMTVNIPAATSLSGTTSYAYDYGQSVNPQLNRSQLTTETSTRNGGYTKTYGYDGGTAGGPGNPTSYQGSSSTFNTDNQNLSNNFAYDGNGNRGYTVASGVTQTFDPENRMTSYFGGALTFASDGDGQQAWNNPGIITPWQSIQKRMANGKTTAAGLPALAWEHCNSGRRRDRTRRCSS